MPEEKLPNCEGVIWSTIKPTVVEPTAKHRFTIILCHGRGSNGRTFKDEIFQSTSSKGLNLRDHFPSVKWVFPSAGLPFDPRESVEDEAQWFAISSLKNPDHEQIRQRYGISESIKYLHQITDQEIEGINGKSSRVILGGISQGCAVAIHALLSAEHRLNSFIGFCSWLPFSRLVKSDLDRYLNVETRLERFYRLVFQINIGSGERLPADVISPDFMPVQTPCFLSHNADDDIVDVKLGRSLRDALRAIDMKVTWDEHEHSDKAPRHWIHEPEGIDNLVAFLETRMGVPKETD